MNESFTSHAVEVLLEKREYDFSLAKAHALFLGWVEAFQPVIDTHDILAVESEFTFPLLNPESEAASRSFVEAGKLDGRLRDRKSGLTKVLEHKTTSDSIEADSHYWPRLAMDSQISKYVLAEMHAGQDVSSALYDVVRKPAQRPSQVALRDDAGRKIVLDAAGNRVTTKDGKKYRETGDTALGYTLQTRPETPTEFHARVLEELRSEPAAYYVQKEIPRSDSALLEYMEDAWSLSQQILYFRSKKLWPRNPSACVAFGMCEFFELCSGRATVDGIRFAQKEKKHSELEIVEGDKQFLTNSRLTAFRKCARYHFLRYEEPVEPVSEASDALRIGTYFHVAVEAYLKLFIKK